MKELVLDISHWDGNIDLQAWKEKHNLWGVIIKAGGNETGLGRYEDPMFRQNYRKAKSLGLHIGSYYYTVTTDTENAAQDAHHFSDLLDDFTFDLPCYMDVEDPRQFALSARDLTDVIKTFCDTLRSRGYYAGLYTGGSAWLSNMYADELRDYANWIAWWRESWPYEAGDIGMWQQGCIGYDTGEIVFDDVGWDGYHDCDWCAIDYPSRIFNGDTAISENSSSPAETTPQESTGEIDSRIQTFCDLMYTACAVWSLGYDQYNREDIWDGGSCDCSSLVCWAARTAGFDIGDASYTGNMSDNFTARGWVRLPPELSLAQPGDILLNDTCHTAAVISGYGWDATVAQASIDERGLIAGGQQGDQTGHETNLSNMYEYSRGWDCILRYGDSAVVVDDQPLVIDGIGGFATIRAWQAALGTFKDGVISGQLRGNKEYFNNIISVTWERTGSALVKAIQARVGATIDGYWGPDTSRAIQRFLTNNGYDIGPDGVDGYFGENSVKALQQSLNDKIW